MRVLGIETSCDETGVAVVEDGAVRSNLLASQVEVHERFGGVVPELASRAHVEALNPLLEQALGEAGVGFGDLDGVAVTVGPGLVGALLVGIAAAKSISLAARIPIVGVNHLEGHILANAIEHGPDLAPAVCLVVSGGHTMLVHMPEPHRYEILGQTVDDAAGEAFDKIARFIGLGFPGGPALDRLAQQGDPDAIRFPRAMADSGDYDFSLSGLKTLLRHVRPSGGRPRVDRPTSRPRSKRRSWTSRSPRRWTRPRSVGSVASCSAAASSPTRACASAWTRRAPRPGSRSASPHRACAPTTGR
jgi:N6-L-threonylcarbamoyladenine synthase